MKDNITLDDLLTSNGKYPERKKFADELVIENATTFLGTLNAFLKELGVDLTHMDISSGFRPADVNKHVANAAAKSNHVLGRAVDFVDDKNHTLGKLALSRQDLLLKYDLWIEDLGATTGAHQNWMHVDNHTRSKRPSNVFKP